MSVLILHLNKYECIDFTPKYECIDFTPK